jgi:large subunit ribosomal protein L13
VDTLSYKTVSASRQTVNKEWVVIDAKNAVLGRLATQVAMVLRGKHKPSYTPHVDCGDHVIVINAESIRLTGKKWSDKVYIHHTGYPGGQRSQTAIQMKAKSPSLLVENAVRGMLPKSTLGRELFRHLHVYNGSEHPHEAQQPKEIQL